MYVCMYVMGSNSNHCTDEYNSGQVVYTHASVTRQYNWYQPMGGDGWWL